MKKNQKKLSVGIIGLGRMGLMHAGVFNSLEQSKVVAVADPSKIPAKQLGILNPKISVYKSAEDMFDKEELDCVLIASPVSTHIPLALTCAERGIPFLLEKPLSLNAEEARPLVDLLQSTNVLNMIGHVYRFHNSFEKGKEILDVNCLGNIQRVTSNIYVSQLFKKGKGWRYDPKLSGGGVLMALGTHVLDLLTWYFGRVDKVNAKVKSVYSEGIEDFAHLMLSHENGIDSVLDCSWSVRFKRKIDVKIDILGDNGTLVVSEDSILLYLDEARGGWPAGKTDLNASDLYKPVPVDIGTPKFTFQNSHFIESILASKMPSPVIEEAYHVQQIVDSAYESSEKNADTIRLINNYKTDGIYS